MLSECPIGQAVPLKQSKIIIKYFKHYILQVKLNGNFSMSPLDLVTILHFHIKFLSLIFTAGNEREQVFLLSICFKLKSLISL